MRVNFFSERFPSIASAHPSKPGFLWVAVLSLFLGCDRVAAASGEVIAETDKVAVIVAIEPVVRGQWIGTSFIGRKEWEAADTGFNANEVALTVAKGGLKREAQIVDGVALRIPATSVETGAFPRGDEDLARKLSTFANALNVDMVIAIQGTEAVDWISRTSERLRGGGVYTKGVIGGRRSHAYSALSLRIYSRAARKIVVRDQDLRSRPLLEVNWEGSWNDYPVIERKKILVELDAMTKAGTRAFLAKVGLMEPATEEEEALGGLFTEESVRGETSIPENELRIPDGISREKAREVIVAGLTSRGWTVEPVDAGNAEKIVAILREKKKETRVEVTFAERVVTLIPALHKIQKDGTREAIEPNLKAHQKLRDALWEELLKALP